MWKVWGHGSGKGRDGLRGRPHVRDPGDLGKVTEQKFRAQRTPSQGNHDSADERKTFLQGLT